jgi:hypothetical protein
MRPTYCRGVAVGRLVAPVETTLLADRDGSVRFWPMATSTRRTAVPASASYRPAETDPPNPRLVELVETTPVLTMGLDELDHPVVTIGLDRLDRPGPDPSGV